MPKLELFDETFDPNRTSTYELSIRVSPNGFSFCVKDQVKQCYVGLVSDSFNSFDQVDDWHPAIDSLLKSYAWLKGDFAQVKFCFESPTYTFSPKELYDSSKAKSILELVHAIDELDEVRYSELPEDVVCIYTIPSMLASEWLKVQPQTKFLSHCEPILAYRRATSSSSESVSVVVSESSNLVTLTLNNGSSLLHCSTLPIQTAEDTTYHLLNICQTLSLNPNDLNVTLISNGSKKEEIEPLLSRFFAKVDTYKPWGEFHYCYLLNRYKSRFANLFIQSLCE